MNKLIIILSSLISYCQLNNNSGNTANNYQLIQISNYKYNKIVPNLKKLNLNTKQVF